MEPSIERSSNLGNCTLEFLFFDVNKGFLWYNYGYVDPSNLCSYLDVILKQPIKLSNTMCLCEDNDDKSSSSEHHLKMT